MTDPADDESAMAELIERETPYGLLQRARLLQRRRHHAQAAVLLERARRQEPGKASILEPLARAYYDSGRTDAAVGVFEDLIEIDPSSAWGHFGLGQSLKRLGSLDAARKHLRLAVALAPGSDVYRSALARLG
jgi:tetratricopeptide (TPR) repeat protein